MKYHIKIFMAIFSALLVPIKVWSQDTLPVMENFNYPAGLLQNSGSRWIKVSGSTDDLNVVEGNLEYDGYPLNAAGNSIRISGSGTEDDKMFFAAQSAAGATVYASFLLNVENIEGLGSGDYFAALGNGSSTFSARIFIRSNGTCFQLGIARNTSIVAGWDSTNLSPGITYMVAVGYTIVPGSRNDIARLWINPGISADDSIVSAIDSNTAAKDASFIDGFFIRQGSETPNAVIDAIIIKLARIDSNTYAGTKSSGIPRGLVLAQNYPNPFNPVTTIEFSVPVSGYAVMKIFSLSGQVVMAPFKAFVQAGCSNSVLFDGRSLASGVYCYSVEFQPIDAVNYACQRIVKKMILLR
jgi:hypothetical protein